MFALEVVWKDTGLGVYCTPKIFSWSLSSIQKGIRKRNWDKFYGSWKSNWYNLFGCLRFFEYANGKIDHLIVMDIWKLIKSATFWSV